jgi:competence protein ComEA
LDALPGIGPALAQRVVAYRVANGPYRSVADLEKVSGIGPGRLARLSGLVRVEESGGDGQ